jgi:hypothetical protein
MFVPNWRTVLLFHLHFTVSDYPIVTTATPRSFVSFPIIPLCLLIDICSCYQTERSTRHCAFIYPYNMFRPFVPAFFRKNDNNINWKVYRGMWRGFGTLVAKHAEEHQFGWSRRRREDNIKMGHTEKRWTWCSLTYRRRVGGVKLRGCGDEDNGTWVFLKLWENLDYVGKYQLVREDLRSVDLASFLILMRGPEEFSPN